VQIWNRRAEDLWGVRHDEALEHHLLSLDFGLPVERLAMPLRTVLGGGSERESAVLEAVNRRGRAIGCATTILPLRTAGGDGSGPVHGAVILMEEEPAG
jgi:two-component system, chemotaxis family, CheB/CheR fusion protein